MRTKRKGKSPKGKVQKPAQRTPKGLGPGTLPSKGPVPSEAAGSDLGTGFMPIRWDYLAAALVFGYFGSFYWFDHHPHWWKGAPLQLLSILCLWWAFPYRTATASQVPQATPPSDPTILEGAGQVPGKRLPLFLGILLLAGIGQSFFLKGNVPNALILWGLALFFFLGMKFQSLAGTVPGNGRNERFLFWAILIGASFMRFPFLWEHCTGLQVDEGHCVIDGFEFAEGKLESPFVTTGWGANASFHFWWLGRFMEIFGQSLPAARGFSAVVSLAALFAFYRLSRCFFGAFASLTATALMSFGWWYLFYSLSPFQNILVVLWELLTFLFLFRALRDGKKLDYALAGLFLSMMLMEYLPGRLGILMVGVILAGLLATEGPSFFKRHWKGFSFGGLVMVWWMGPFIRYFIEHFEYCMGRSKGLNLLAEIQRTGNIHLLWEKWYWTFLSAFHFNPSADLRFSAKAPMLDPVSGALFLLGFVLLWKSFGRRPFWFVFSGLFFGLFANAMAIQGQNPDATYINGQRFFILVPFLFLLGAWALDSFQRAFSRTSLLVRGILSALFLISFGYSLHWNSRVYYKGFRDFKACTSYWGDLGFNHIQVGEFINENFSRCHMVVDWEYDSSTVQVLIKGKSAIHSMGNNFKVPIDKKVDRNVMIMTLAWNFKPIQDAIRTHYPRAKWGSLPDVLGRPALVTIEIPREDIEALQGGVTQGSLP